MRRAMLLAIVMGSFNSLCVNADEAPPPWAFAVNPPGAQSPADDGVPRRIPGSPVAFTLGQLRDLYHVPDWHPDNHPPMPDIVAYGRKPAVFACGFCHLPNGLGRPENSSLAGLSADYIVQQVLDFKSGARTSSEPKSLPTNFMIAVAKGVSEDELRTAAQYFARLKRRPWIRVVETDSVPQTKVSGWMLVDAGTGSEPIGQRVIEMPEDLERTELRDSESSFIAYVPTGAIAKGEALAHNRAGNTVACAICHGADLRGLGPVPGLAGRSPSYLVRQLYDMQHGARNGQWAQLMQPVVARLSLADMVSLAAYAASLAP